MRLCPAALLFLTALIACAAAPPPSPEPPALEPKPEPEATAVAEPAPPPVTTTMANAPERSRPPSTASYEEALSVPEPVDINDDHAHLTDVQLWSPMGGVLMGCRVPSTARITIKTAVQFGRAIGVTVNVRLERGQWAKRPRPEAARAAKAERSATAKVAACVDHNVREVVWPPNRRRDSFTTEL